MNQDWPNKLGLRGVIDPDAHPDIAKVILQARIALREPLSAPALRRYCELFDADRFNDQASIAENLLFGTPVGPVFAVEGLPANPYVQQVLDKLGLGYEGAVGKRFDFAQATALPLSARNLVRGENHGCAIVQTGETHEVMCFGKATEVGDGTALPADPDAQVEYRVKPTGVVWRREAFERGVVR